MAGNFSAYWLGLAIVVADGHRRSWSARTGLGELMLAPAVFAFGLVAFGFLGMGPVTIAVDSYGPVTDNAQSVFELSVIETLPEHQGGAQEGLRLRRRTSSEAKDLLEENDGAGNTFKATAKPVLIGTAVVGATTMIFSIIVMLTDGLKPELVANLSLLHPPFLLGLITGGAVIYWFTGASIAGGVDGRLPRGRVHQGEHQARERREGVGRGQQEGRGDLHAVRAEGHVQHLPDGVLLDAGVRVPRAVSSSSAT